MFPQSGSGSVQIESVYPNVDRVMPVPSHLCPSNQADIQYQLFNKLNQTGNCYCEVSLGECGVIDLVWVEPIEGCDTRVVGIEIKTGSALSEATHKINEQVSKYANTTITDLTEADYVASEVNKRADEVFVLDEVWLVITEDHDCADTPEDGLLKYEPQTGRIEYEIDPTALRDDTNIPDFEYLAGEEQLTATLWNRYRSAETLVAAESWITRPSDRIVKDGSVKYASGKGQRGQTKHADLVVGKKEEVIPLSEDSTIRGLEIKQSFDADTQSNLDDQLPLYRDSKMFSEVYLVVPSEFERDASEFLATQHPTIGLLTFNPSERATSKVRPAETLELQKIPTRQCPGESLGFALKE